MAEIRDLRLKISESKNHIKWFVEAIKDLENKIENGNLSDSKKQDLREIIEAHQGDIQFIKEAIAHMEAHLVEDKEN